MELNNKALLFWGHAAMFEARVEVVHPPEAAALSCPVEACMNIENVQHEEGLLDTKNIYVCNFALRISK